MDLARIVRSAHRRNPGAGHAYSAANPPGALSRVCPPLLRAVTATIFVLAVLATDADAQSERRIHPDPPVLEKTIGDGAVELYRPSLIAISDSGHIYVFDHGDMAVRAFDVDGRELWTVGRRGGGPGEFASASDLQTDASGNVYVLDNDNLRITQVSPRGNVERMVSLPRNTAAFGLLPLAGSGVTIVPRGTDAMAMNIPASNTTGRMSRYPESISFSTPIVGESYTARLRGGAAMVFRWSSRIVVLGSGGEVERVFDGIEATPFPEARVYPISIPGVSNARATRVDPDARQWSLDSAAHGDRLYILSGALSRNGGSLVDVYDTQSATYLGSHELPPPYQDRIALLPDGRLVTLERDLLPVIRIWRLPELEQD